MARAGSTRGEHEEMPVLEVDVEADEEHVSSSSGEHFSVRVKVSTIRERGEGEDIERLIRYMPQENTNRYKI